jgi:hypothetical protein
MNNFKRHGNFLNHHITQYKDTVINMRMTSMGCPLQYEGRVNGFEAYFRNRHGEWSFEIYEGKMLQSKVLFRREGPTDYGIGLEAMLEAEDKIMRLSSIFVRKHFGEVK